MIYDIYKIYYFFMYVFLASGGLLQRYTMFNGAFSENQLDWLASILSLADEKWERVIIVCKYNQLI